MSPATIAQRRFAMRNSTAAANMKSCKSAFCKTFKSVAITIAHALDDNEGGIGIDRDGRRGVEVIKEYPELDYRCVSRRASDASVGTLTVNNYERQLALPLGKLEVHRAPPTPVRRRPVSRAHANGSANAGNDTKNAAGSAGGVGRLTSRKAAVGRENRRTVIFAHPAVRNVSGEEEVEESGQTRPVSIILPSANHQRLVRKVDGDDDGVAVDGKDGAAAALVVRRPKLSPYPWTPRSVSSETTASTKVFSETATTRSSDRANSLLSGSVNFFRRGDLLASRPSSTVRRLQVRHVSPTVDLTGVFAGNDEDEYEDEDVAAQRGVCVPRITVTQASTRGRDVAGLDLRPNNSTDTLAEATSSSSVIEIPRVLRPKRVKAKLVTIPPRRSRVVSTATADVEYGRRWRDSDAAVGVERAAEGKITETQYVSGCYRREAGPCNGESCSKHGDRMSLFRPYHPRESWSTNIDKYTTSATADAPHDEDFPPAQNAIVPRMYSPTYSRTSSQVSAEQNEQLVNSLGMSSKAYNRLLAALDRGSFLYNDDSDNDNDDDGNDDYFHENETINENKVEAGSSSTTTQIATNKPPRAPATIDPRPIPRIPTTLRPQHSRNPPPAKPQNQNPAPICKTTVKTDAADDVFARNGLSETIARQRQLQKVMLQREREYRVAIRELSQTGSGSKSKSRSESDPKPQVGLSSRSRSKVSAEPSAEPSVKSNGQNKSQMNAASKLRPKLEPEPEPSYLSLSSDLSFYNDDAEAVLRARLRAMSGSGDCFRATMSAGDAARGRRGKRRDGGRGV